MTRELSQEVIAHIKQLEGFRSEAYPDPGSRDGTPWTIGYGQTRINGRAVRQGDTINEASAAAWTERELLRVSAVVERLVKVELTDNQHGALVSFTYNIGDQAFADSTLLRKLNAGQYDAVPAQLARWKFNDGKVMEGLINRRASEAGLWARGGFASSNTVAAQPPKEPSAIDAIVKDPGGLAGIGAAASGLIGAIADQPILQIGAVVLIGVLVWRFVIARKQADPA